MGNFPREPIYLLSVWPESASLIMSVQVVNLVLEVKSHVNVTQESEGKVVRLHDMNCAWGRVGIAPNLY
jgi:hypothetical protein